MSPVSIQSRASRRGVREAVPAPAVKVVRCAVYTRKSTNEGLDSDFSSLDNQREACAAYILSQKQEGWVSVGTRYDDGGFSGGTIERPALQQLIGEIEAGKIDCVVVYKIDRLSRSLLDFTRMWQLFEQRGVNFVAVTQHIDTTTSAGRLMLNVLMSFAQFERELGSERTREKIHAARKKGRWIGGPPLLGYDIDRDNHRLVINEDEANMVRELFDLYLQKRTLLSVVREVNSRGWIKKRWVSGTGKTRGGKSFDKVYLQRMLTNPIYIGKVSLHGEVFDGLQERVVHDETFQEVDRLLRANRNGQANSKPNKHDALLRGIMRCGSCGCSMGHHFTRKRGGRLFRYYRCINELKRGRQACPMPALSAGEIELFVVDEIRKVARDPELTRQVFEEALMLQAEQTRKLKSEQQRLRKQQIQRDEERSRVVSDIGTHGQHDAVTERLSEIEAKSQTLTQRLAKIDDELSALGDAHVDMGSVGASLSEFDALWDVLVPKEQAHLIQLIIERIDCFPPDELRIVFRTSNPEKGAPGAATQDSAIDLRED